VYLNPKDYNLSSRALIKLKSANHLIIVINRKSRIIMKDGFRVYEQKKSIQKVNPNTKVSLETSAPVCKKTKKYLFSKDVRIIEK
jgi:hypothetical protein